VTPRRSLGNAIRGPLGIAPMLCRIGRMEWPPTWSTRKPNRAPAETRDQTSDERRSLRGRAILGDMVGGVHQAARALRHGGRERLTHETSGVQRHPLGYAAEGSP
jgi:hypothetical protein